MSEQIEKCEFIEYAKGVAKEIGEIIPSAKVEVINQNTIQIDNDGIISSVRVREVKRKGSYCDVKVTHGGKSKYEDNGKVVGESWYSKKENKGEVFVTIKEKAIKAIASESTSWDIDNISEAHADNHNHTRIHEHPTMHWSRSYNANGKVGISVEVQTPNTEQWEAMKKEHGKKTREAIPSGKIVFKIISESDVDFDIDNDRVSIQGTIEQVDKVIARIMGNPFTDW
jgi:hypothetical protein